MWSGCEVERQIGVLKNYEEEDKTGAADTASASTSSSSSSSSSSVTSADGTVTTTDENGETHIITRGAAGLDGSSTAIVPADSSANTQLQGSLHAALSLSFLASVSCVHDCLFFMWDCDACSMLFLFSIFYLCVRLRVRAV